MEGKPKPSNNNSGEPKRKWREASSLDKSGTECDYADWLHITRDGQSAAWKLTLTGNVSGEGGGR